ncbi:MAG: HTH-type transcriptional regulator IscR [Acidobacteria bacterium ADurb.Bin340]|nr:MAG: HTH-type transcriptional regulator IscR [Acidobacteria bacterium ADurb.Bin340]HOD34038.1 Rrf2 family transcriptional regulator [Holophaga sp.]HQL48106.1 Rrf2 family transcriptional regulator [Holophaga sp.]
MKISARGRYSMQALFDLAHYSHGQPVPLHLIAQRQGLSLPFLEQIFNKLKKAGIVASVRGPKGGYIITRPCNEVSVGDVLRLTDSTFYAVVKEDPAGAKTALQADEKMNRLLWQQLSDHIASFMDGLTLADLCVESGSNACPNCTCPDYTSSLEGRLKAEGKRACGLK